MELLLASKLVNRYLFFVAQLLGCATESQLINGLLLVVLLFQLCDGLVSAQTQAKGGVKLNDHARLHTMNQYYRWNCLRSDQ